MSFVAGSQPLFQRKLHAGFGQGARAFPRYRQLSGTCCRGASPSSSPSAPSALVAPDKQARTSFHHGITYTSYEVNTSAIKFNTSGVRVLTDPWFVGTLNFSGAEWMYSGSKRVIGRNTRVDLNQIMEETDVLIITQGLDDHCHVPTLSEISNKSIPVVANAEAAARMRPLGYSNITVLAPGQSTTVTGRSGGRLRIHATAGALVGPPWSARQLGLLMREEVPPGERPACVYLESHCDYDAASVAAGVRAVLGPAALGAGSGGKEAGEGEALGVDVVISPVISSLLGVGAASYALVQGDINLVALAKLLHPKVLLPLLNHEIDHTGPLTSVMWMRGDERSVQALLQKEGLDTRVEWPAPPGEALAIAL